jgi:cell wall-associated NlpC family hydrolase
VQYVFARLGVHVARTTQAQFNASRKIARADKQLGDLIFFGTPNNIYHVGIYAGNHKMWVAPHEGSVVQLQEIWTDNYYVGRL